MSGSITQVSKGSILLADPYLSDPNFQRSVIFVTEFDEDSVVGFVLNNPTHLQLGQAVEDLPGVDAQLFLGGPAEPDKLNFLHRRDDLIPGGYEVTEGIFWGGDFDTVRTLIHNDEIDPAEMRFFIGYSGWSPQMLNRELKEKSWFVTDPRNDYIFADDPSTLWRNVLKDMGGAYALLVNAPPQPWYN